MPAISRLTTTYNSDEDRIQMNVELGQDGAAVLWLTQKLANLVVTALTKWLEEETEMSVAPRERDTILHWEQHSARRQQMPEPPVVIQTQFREILLHQVDLQRCDGQYRIVFCAKGDFSAVLALDSTQLHQWLGIVFRLYDKAGWTNAVWPAWITRQFSPAPHSENRTMH